MFPPHNYLIDNLYISGTANSQWVGSGNYKLSCLKITGKGPVLGKYALNSLSFSGDAFINSIANGNISLKKITIKGITKNNYLVNGDYLLNIVFNGAAESEYIAIGNYGLKDLRILGKTIQVYGYVANGNLYKTGNIQYSGIATIKNPLISSGLYNINKLRIKGILNTNIKTFSNKYYYHPLFKLKGKTEMIGHGILKYNHETHMFEIVLAKDDFIGLKFSRE